MKIMRMLLPAIFVLFGFCITNGYGQSLQNKKSFFIDGKIIGRDTGTVVLWYENDSNRGISDTVKLVMGKFQFAGTVNHASESILWTDLKRDNFDNPSVIHFLLEPNKIAILYRILDPLHPMITGSPAQIEKQNWDKEKSGLLISRTKFYDSLVSLSAQFRHNKSTFLNIRMDQIQEKRDSIKQKIKSADLLYISGHPDSYLSGYLLWQHRRQLPVDSLQTLYSSLSNAVKQSSIGHSVLIDLYPLTDDNNFRKANPLIDAAFDERLRKINSVFDLNLKDTVGNNIGLGSFKSKFLVIDFWASWCGPCIANIPALDQLIKDYRTDSIQFVSISLDRDNYKWKEAIRKYDFQGIQLSDSNEFNSLPAIYCKVLGVPKYLIADQRGHIIIFDAPQARDAGLKTLLDNLFRAQSKQ
jgi:thiol-disulfide isomerase/thioredoxin